MYQHNKKDFFCLFPFYSVTYEQNTSVSNASNVASDQYGKLFDIQLLTLVYPLFRGTTNSMNQRGICKFFLHRIILDQIMNNKWNVKSDFWRT